MKTWLTYIQVREGSLLKFDYPAEGFSRPTWQKPPSKKGYNGEVTDHTRKRIIQAVDVLLQLNPNRRLYNPITGNTHDFRVSFATLTVTDDIPPNVKEANQALAKFLRHFRKPWGKRKLSEQIGNYVWKLELQERGTIHYHITSGAFLHHVEINRVWNDIQREMGWNHAYYQKTGSWYPNSTDIHAVWEVKNLGGYISKYMGKKQFIECSEMGFLTPTVPVMLGGKIWGCSEYLRGKKRFVAEADKWTWLRVKAAMDFHKVKPVEFERCTFYQGADESELSTALLNKYRLWKL